MTTFVALAQIAAPNNEKLPIVKLDIDESPNTALDYQAMSIPP